jgi:hypothetical protein
MEEEYHDNIRFGLQAQADDVSNLLEWFHPPSLHPPPCIPHPQPSTRQPKVFLHLLVALFQTFSRRYRDYRTRLERGGDMYAQVTCREV